MDVTGRELKSRPGKSPHVPQGKNTELSEDGTKLTAVIDGDVTFQNNTFCVDKILTIAESVDNSVGNLDYNGNILIKADSKAMPQGILLYRGLWEAPSCVPGVILRSWKA